MRASRKCPGSPRVSIKSEMLRSFRETNARFLLFFTAIVTAFAAAIAVGVVYNSARIALAERAWELASLRVLGFTRREVSGAAAGRARDRNRAGDPARLVAGLSAGGADRAMMQAETVTFPVIITSAHLCLRRPGHPGRRRGQRADRAPPDRPPGSRGSIENKGVIRHAPDQQNHPRSSPASRSSAGCVWAFRAATGHGRGRGGHARQLRANHRG